MQWKNFLFEFASIRRCHSLIEHVPICRCQMSEESLVKKNWASKWMNNEYEPVDKIDFLGA